MIYYDITNPYITNPYKKRYSSIPVKVTHLDFSEAHHPNFERLMLYCLSSVGQAASHISQRLNELELASEKSR